MLLIPLQPVPNQTMTVPLANQNVQLNVYQKYFGLFMDVYVNHREIISGAPCQNLNRIIRDTYLGFIGDFGFMDTQGSSDPDYKGLGSRYLLVYLEASDLA